MFTLKLFIPLSLFSRFPWSSAFQGFVVKCKYICFHAACGHAELQNPSPWFADCVQADLNQEKLHLTFASERFTYYAGNNNRGDIYSNEHDVLDVAKNHQEPFSLQGMIGGGRL